MRSVFLILLLLCQALGLGAHGFSPSPELLRRLRALRAPGNYILVAFSDRLPRGLTLPRGIRRSTGPDLGLRWAKDDLILSAVLDRDLRCLSLGLTLEGTGTGPPIPRSVDPLTWELQAQFAGPGWVLLRADLQEVAHGHVPPGPVPPTPEWVRKTMEHDGWVWKRPALEDYLRANPGDGQARVEMLADLIRQEHRLVEAGCWTPELQQTLQPQLETHLAELRRTPNPELAWRQPPPHPFLDLAGDLASGRLNTVSGVPGLLSELRQALRLALDADPEQAALWRLWLATAPPGQPTRFLEALDAVPPLPGKLWPAEGLRTLLRSRLEAEPAGVASLLRRGMEAEPASLDLKQQRIRAWGSLAFEALLRADRMEDAASQLAWVRGLLGSSWTGFAPGLRDLYTSRPGAPAPVPLEQAHIYRLNGLLAQAPLADLPTPAHSALRAVLLDPARDALAWARLQDDGRLDAWSPRELHWTALTSEELRAFRGREDLREGQQWLLLQHGLILDGGPGLPSPTALITAIQAQGLPRLAELDAFLAVHPGRLDADRERLELLRRRMPHPRLEAEFRLGLAEGLLPLGELQPFLEPEAWRLVARRVCGDLEAGLAHWPFHDSHWEAYASWSALLPTAPRIGQVLRQTPTWPYRSGVPQPGPIPGGAALAVSQVLGRGTRWAELADWSEALWERGLRDWLRLSACFVADREPTRVDWFDTQVGEFREILSLWAAALRALGQEDRFRTLVWDLELIRPGMGKLLGSIPIP
jgi:hypothetical protein